MMILNGKTRIMFWRTTKRNRVKNLHVCVGRATHVLSITIPEIVEEAQKNLNIALLLALMLSMVKNGLIQAVVIAEILVSTASKYISCHFVCLNKSACITLPHNLLFSLPRPLPYDKVIQFFVSFFCMNLVEVAHLFLFVNLFPVLEYFLITLEKSSNY